MRYKIDTLKLELLEKMKTMVKERQYKWQSGSEITEF